MCAPVRRATTGAGSAEQLAGSCVEGYVTGLLLDALAPAALEVSLTAAGQAGARRAQVDRIWQQRLERAEFAADRARRQYQLTEPENRLVARQLEKDWEAALAERQHLGEEYDRFTASRPRTLTPAERAQIRALAADVPAVWHAPTTTDADRKQLIRHLVDQVRVEVLGTSEKVDIQVVWAGGHRTTGQISRPVACLTQLSYYPQLAQRARELADAGLALAQIAGQLNAEGFRPPKRCETFTANAVSDLLRAAGAQRSAIPARAHRRPSPSTNGGCATWPSTWPCLRSPSTPGSAAAGPPATCTRPSSGQWCGPTPPRSNACARCTRHHADSTTGDPGCKIKKRTSTPLRKEPPTMPTSRSYDSTAACSSRSPTARDKGTPGRRPGSGDGRTRW